MHKWRQIQKENFTSWEKLADFLELPRAPIDTSFPLNLPKRLAEKIDKGTFDDPILRQFLPTLAEKKNSPLELLDPVGDLPAQKCPKLLHKYRGRALLVTTSACAMHCRYCFRQNFPYEKTSDFSSEIAYIASDPTIHEVILSGGDPLSLSDKNLTSLLISLAEIPHLKLIRFHSRFPIGIPERITPELITLFASLPQQVIFVIHCNHANELDPEIITALKSLNVPLLNQSVLLKNINDDPETLQTLCLTLAQNGILPYYLHQLDPVAGTSHFEVAKERGLALIEELRNSLPGYAVPKYVQEIAGEESKTLLSTSFAQC